MTYAKRTGPVLLVVLLCLGCMVGKPSVPYQGTLTDMPVKRPVTVVRDTQGVPHIYASNACDLYFGLGYTMAQDRLFQMDTYRHVALGRLSEWFGNLSLGQGVSLVQVDMLLKCFDLERHTAQAAAGLPAESKVLLERFVGGVNQFIADCRGRPPVEYRWLRIPPEPWTVPDVMAIPEAFGIGLGMINLGTEILYEALTHEVGPDMTREFFRLYTETGDPPGERGRPDGAGNVGDAGGVGLLPPSGTKVGPSLRSLIHPTEGRSVNPLHAFNNVLLLGSLLARGVPTGSNNWVVAGSVSESGAPVLGNDPHVPLGPAPSFWYHAVLHGDGFSVGGLLYPGYPAFGAGWNGEVAWGVTNIMADQLDLYRERTDPANPDFYETAEGWKRFETRTVLCKVRLGRDRSFTLRQGIHGFLVPPEALKNKISRGAPWLMDPSCLRYVTTDPAAYFQGQVLLMRAQSGEAVNEALALIGRGPTAYNYVWADRSSGDIGYHAAGRIPVRADGQGFAPKNGWATGVDWDGYVPFDALPAEENPADGVLVTANNRIVSPSYPWYISVDYARPYRARRILEMLEDPGNRSVKGFERIQADVYNTAAVPVLERLRSAFSGPDGVETLNREEREAWDMLMGWDLETTAESPGAALYEVFFQQLLETVFAEKMGRELARMALSTDLVAAKVLESGLDEPDNPWFRQDGGPDEGSLDSLFRKAFREGVRTARNRLGRDRTRWSWGRLHKLVLGHPFGRIPMLGGPFRIETLPYPGDNDTVNGGYFLFDDWQYPVVAGSASRFVVDLARPEGAWFNCSTGMSGEPSSAYFKNLTAGWYDNQYFRTTLAETPGEVPEGVSLLLAPSGGNASE